MDLRTNQNYTITNSIKIGAKEFVLGVHKKHEIGYATWQCKNGNEYFWGHYYSSQLAAQKDFCNRALEEVRYIENKTVLPKEKEPVR